MSRKCFVDWKGEHKYRCHLKPQADNFALKYTYSVKKTFNWTIKKILDKDGEVTT